MSIADKFALNAWLQAARDLMVEGNAVPKDERTMERAEELRARSMQLALQFADAAGGFENAEAAYQILHHHLGEAVTYRWPRETVALAVSSYGEESRPSMELLASNQVSEVTELLETLG